LTEQILTDLHLDRLLVATLFATAVTQHDECYYQDRQRRHDNHGGYRGHYSRRPCRYSTVIVWTTSQVRPSSQAITQNAQHKWKNHLK